MLLYKQVRYLILFIFLATLCNPLASQIWNVGDSIQAIMPNGLIYHFDFSDSIIADNSGNNISTSLIGSKWVEGRYGDTNEAILFSENTDVLLTESIPLPTEYSIMVWFKPLPLDEDGMGTLIKTRAIVHSGGDHPLTYVRPTGDLGLYTYDTSVGKKKRFSFGSSIKDEKLDWNQLVLTATSSDSTYCYINGDLAGALPFKAIGNALSIGNNVFEFIPSQGYDQPFGTIDEIALWNRKLSHAQIRQLFAGIFTISMSKTRACKNEQLEAYISPAQPNVSYQLWDKNRNLPLSNVLTSEQGLLTIPFQLQESAEIVVLARDLRSGSTQFLNYSAQIRIIPQENKQIIPENIYVTGNSAIVSMDSLPDLFSVRFYSLDNQLIASNNSCVLNEGGAYYAVAESQGCVIRNDFNLHFSTIFDIGEVIENKIYNEHLMLNLPFQNSFADSSIYKHTIITEDEVFGHVGKLEITYYKDLPTSAASFDSAYLEVQQAYPIILDNGFTISIWARAFNLYEASFLIDYGYVADYGVGINFEPNGYFSVYYVNNGISKKFDLNSWHHYAIVYDGHRLSLFYDGIQVGIKEIVNPNSILRNYPLRIGAESKGLERFWKGDIDDVKVYDTPLAQDLISILYNYKETADIYFRRDPLQVSNANIPVCTNEIFSVSVINPQDDVTYELYSVFDGNIHSYSFENGSTTELHSTPRRYNDSIYIKATDIWGAEKILDTIFVISIFPRGNGGVNLIDATPCTPNLATIQFNSTVNFQDFNFSWTYNSNTISHEGSNAIINNPKNGDIIGIDVYKQGCTLPVFSDLYQIHRIDSLNILHEESFPCRKSNHLLLAKTVGDSTIYSPQWSINDKVISQSWNTTVSDVNHRDKLMLRIFAEECLEPYMEDSLIVTFPESAAIGIEEGFLCPNSGASLYVDIPISQENYMASWYVNSYLVESDAWNFHQDTLTDGAIFSVEVNRRENRCEKPFVTDSIIFTFNDSCVKPEVYEFISRNGDELNKVFRIKNGEYYSNIKVHIYNKWNVTIFESHDYRNNWDGGDVPEGEYYYQVIIDDETFRGALYIR